MKDTRNGKKNGQGHRLNTSVQVPVNYHWKVLGALVEDLKGYLSIDDIYVLKTLIRNKDFSNYLSLDDHWGLHCIAPGSPMSAFSTAKARYGISSLLKKYLPEPDDSLDAVALEGVLAAEKACRWFNNFNYEKLVKGEDAFTVDLLTYARSFLRKLLGDSVPVRDVVENSKHGPGANLDTKDGDVTPYAKYRNIPYSCTKDAIGYATFMIQQDERWFRALKNHYREAKALDLAQPIVMTEFWDYVLNVVDHNRITFVTKNAKTSRPIAIEPALNLMLQLGVDGVIRKRLKRWGVDLDSQESNRELARVGSKTGMFATIDLKAASDRISLKICELLLPAEWYDFLINLRASIGQLRDGKKLIYSKMSSMGNGYTFALESAIFTAIIYAVYKINSRKLHFSKNAAVFGDDLIVESDLSTSVEKALELCGFSINKLKSFSKGPIRESCGTDWFKGLPLRPILLQKPPTTVQELYADYNRIQRYLDLRFGITDSNACKTIMRWIPKKLNLIGPYSDEVFDSWIHSSTPVEISPDGFYRFQRVIVYARKKSFPSSTLYGDRYFFQLAHNLKQEVPLPFYIRKKVKSRDGCRFTVLSKGFTVMRKPTLSSRWRTVYSDSWNGFRGR